MNKLLPAEFFARAIQRVPSNPRYPQYRHLGVRLNLLRKPFANYYGDEHDIDSTLDSLIKQKSVVAVHAAWGKVRVEHEWGPGPERRKLVELDRLNAFPDPYTADENPILYLPQALPSTIRVRLTQADDILATILQPTLVAANG